MMMRVRVALLLGASCSLAASVGCSSETADDAAGTSESAQTEASASTNKAVYSAFAAAGAAEDGKIKVHASCSTAVATSSSACTITFDSERPSLTVNGSAEALYRAIDAVPNYPSTTELWGSREVFQVEDILCSRSDRCFISDKQGTSFTIPAGRRANALRGILSNLNVQYASNVRCARTKLQDEVPATLDYECTFKQFDDDEDFYSVKEGSHAAANAAAIVVALKSAGIASSPRAASAGSPAAEVIGADVTCARVNNRVTCSRLAASAP